MIVPVPRSLIVGAVLLLASAGGLMTCSGVKARRFANENVVLLDKIAARDSALEEDAALIRDMRTVITVTRNELADALEYSRAREAAAERLRRDLAEIIPVTSVPGEEPTVGDTLAACRQQFATCQEIAAIEKSRADSLEMVARSAAEHAGALLGDLEVFKTSLAQTQDLLSRAGSQLERADAPCDLVKAGPLRVACPDRTSVAAMAVGSTLVAVGAIEGRREMQWAGLALITIGIIW